MSRDACTFAPGWAKLAAVALERARGIVGSPAVERATSRLLKIDVRRGRGQLHLLWLLQPEDGEAVDRLADLRHQLAAASIETCEVCGGYVPWRGAGRRNEVLCEAHDAPF